MHNHHSFWRDDFYTQHTSAKALLGHVYKNMCIQISKIDIVKLNHLQNHSEFSAFTNFWLNTICFDGIIFLDFAHVTVASKSGPCCLKKNATLSIRSLFTGPGAAQAAIRTIVWKRASNELLDSDNEVLVWKSDLSMRSPLFNNQFISYTSHNYKLYIIQ